MPISDNKKIATLADVKRYNKRLYDSIGKNWDYEVSVSSPSDASKMYQAILKLGDAPHHYKLLICKDINGTHNISEVSLALTTYQNGQTTGYAVNSDDFYVCWDETSEGVVGPTSNAYLAVETTNSSAAYKIKVIGDSAYTESWQNTCAPTENPTYFWTGFYKIPNISTQNSNSAINEKAPTTQTVVTEYGLGEASSSGYTDYIIDNSSDSARSLTVTALDADGNEAALEDGIYRFSITDSVKSFTLNDGGVERTFSPDNGDIASGGLLTYTKSTVDGLTTAYFNYNSPQFTSSDNSIMIKTDDKGKTDLTTGYSLNHHVTAKHLLTYSKISNGKRKFYAYDIGCDLSGQKVRLFDNTDFATPISNGTTCTWTINKMDKKQYIGFFRMMSSKGLCEMELEITSASGIRTTQRMDIMFDTPSDGTFLFVTTMPFDVEVYNNGEYHYAAFIVIPNNWAGTIKARTTGYTNYMGVNGIFFFDATSHKCCIGQGNVSYDPLEPSALGSEWVLVTYDAADEIAGDYATYAGSTKGSDGKTFLPMGKYLVDGIGPMREKEVGDIIPDWEVNDHILHTLGYELDSLKVMIEGNDLTNLQSEDNSVIFTPKDNNIIDLKVNPEFTGQQHNIHITEENKNTYILGQYVYVPVNTTHIHFDEGTMPSAVCFVLPKEEGMKFEDGHRLSMSGYFYIGSGGGGGGSFSHYYYQHIGYQQPTSATDVRTISGPLQNQTSIYYNNIRHGVESFDEFMYWHGTWYDRGFVDKEFEAKLEVSDDPITTTDDGYLNTVTSGSTIVVSAAQLNTLIGHINSLRSTVNELTSALSNIKMMTPEEIDAIYDRYHNGGTA